MFVALLAEAHDDVTCQDLPRPTEHALLNKASAMIYIFSKQSERNDLYFFFGSSKTDMQTKEYWILWIWNKQIIL